jgi:hypothetical protein
MMKNNAFVLRLEGVFDYEVEQVLCVTLTIATITFSFGVPICCVFAIETLNYYMHLGFWIGDICI